VTPHHLYPAILLVVSIARLVQDNYDNIQLHAPHPTGHSHSRSFNNYRDDNRDGRLALDLDKELLLREYLRQALTRVEQDLRQGAYRNRPIQVLANLLWALGSLNFAWSPSDPASTPGAGASSLGGMDVGGYEGSIREAYLTDAAGQMILRHHALPPTFKRAITTELSSMFSRHDPTSDYTPSEGVEGSSNRTGTGTGTGGSVLPYLQSNGLHSTLSNVQSFREFLCPAAQSMSPQDIYNWLGALVRVQIPWSDLPLDFRNAVLVALAEDVPLQVCHSRFLPTPV
jgi:hypothetical protein